MVKKVHLCSLCDYVTNRRSNLSRHLETMHEEGGEERREWECCDLRFSTKSHLKNHRKVCHAKGYQCTACLRLFCR